MINIKHFFQKIKIKLSSIFRRISQFLFISFSKYTENTLWENASACSFGFIFSFVPVVLIIFTVTVSLMKFSPVVFNAIESFALEISLYYDFTPILNSLAKTESITMINIILGIWVIWMARKLFRSVVQGIKKIFSHVSERNDFFYQLFSFISEFVIVLIFIIAIIFTFTFDRFLSLPFFNLLRDSFPNIFNESTHNANRLITFIIYLMFFLFTFYSYRFVSGIKPKTRICLFYSLLSTSIYFVVSLLLNKFMNFTNYNIVYGAVSTVIVILVKVYTFFMIFFFCGEMVYVSQYFDDLLIAQIYVYPNKKMSKITKKVHNFLFESLSLVSTKTEKIILEKNDILFNMKSIPKKIYYISKGFVMESKNNLKIVHKKGEIFGELPPLLKTDYKTNAIAKTKCEIVAIDVNIFLEILQKDKEASAEAISRLGKYTNENINYFW